VTKGRPARRPWVIGAAALAGVIGLGVAVSAGWNPFAGARPEATGSGSPSPSTAAFGGNWAAADVELPQDQSSEMTDVVFYRGHWVAVGVGVRGGAPNEGPQIWISTDLRNWQAVADPQVFPGQVYISSAAVGPGGIVAVGREDSRAQAWFSVDGRSWHAVRQDSFGDGMAMAVEYGAAGYVAVGYSVAGDGTANAAVWRSSDGLTWHGTPAAEGFAATSLMGIAFAHGLEVAVGVTSHGIGPDTGGTTMAWAWRSLDGVDWSRAELPSGDHSYVRDVVASENGFIAVGSGPQGPQVWVSDAGDDWQLLDAEAFPGASDRGGLTSVIASGDRLVAMGFDADDESGWGTIWGSDNGLVWQMIAGREALEGIVLNAVSRGPNGVVAVGNARDPTRDYVAAAWYAR